MAKDWKIEPGSIHTTEVPEGWTINRMPPVESPVEQSVHSNTVLTFNADAWQNKDSLPALVILRQRVQDQLERHRGVQHDRGFHIEATVLSHLVLFEIERIQRECDEASLAQAGY